MSLIVEDGTGIEGADAYVPISKVDSYAAAFGKSGWDTLDNNAKEIHIRKATQFLDVKYPFDAVPLKANQSLLFPAKEFYVRGYAVTGLPRQLVDAACELAILDVSTNLSESVVARTYTYRKVKVGDLEKTERYETDDQSKVFDTVELILRPLLGGQIGSGVSLIKLKRA